jgi:hypothetical protein
VSARKVDFYDSREKLQSGIRREDSRQRSTRNALVRADMRKMSEIAASNRKLAVKLFTSKPTYSAQLFDRDYKQQKAKVQRISRLIW